MIAGFIKQYLFTLLIGTGIILISLLPLSVPGEPPSFLFPGLDKWIHGIMYGVFMVVFLRDYLKQNRWRFKMILGILFLALLCSALIEVVQKIFISSRSGEIRDFLANMGGLVAGLLLVIAVRMIRFGSVHGPA